MGTPSYIVRNRFGTYYFRVSLPKHIRALSPGLPKEIRRSLKTNIKSIALLKARLMWAEFYQQFGNQNKMDNKQAMKFNCTILSTAEFLEFESNTTTLRRLPKEKLSEVITLFVEENTRNGKWRERSKESAVKSLDLFKMNFYL